MSFSRYKTYRESGIEWLGEVPSHWRKGRLKDVVTCNDEVLGESINPAEEIEYIEISDVSLQEGIRATSRLTFGEAPSRARRIVRAGDILISTVRTYLRAISPVTNASPNLIASTGFAVLRTRDVDHRFVGYVVQSEYFIASVIARSSGVSYPAINASDLVRIGIATPPSFAEQIAIVEFLDREISKIDSLVDAQRRLIELLEQKRQTVISHAVTKGLDPTAPMKPSGIEWLGDVPAHWSLMPLRSLYRFVKRQNQDSFDVLSVYRDFGIVPKSSRDDNNNKTPDDLSAYQTVYPGDLVINKMKAWQGSLGVSQIPGITSPDYAVFTPISKARPAYLNWMLRCQLMPDLYRSISNGIRPDQWRLEPDRLKEIVVPIPPAHEQNSIATAISDKTQRFAELILQAEASIRLLSQRREALISAAVTGKIDVRSSRPETIYPAQAEAA